ncbi:MAG: Hsp20/alpha crystallin family protein [Patescibacteria group bacterium]
MFKDKRSFFERITGSVPYEENAETETEETAKIILADKGKERGRWLEEEPEVGELTVDVYQTPGEIIIQAMVAGVKPEDLSITINREMITVKGTRERPAEAREEDYIHQELYWGAFSRTVILPCEVETEESEAIERHGLLTLRLPKIDKEKIQKIRVKSI